MGKGVNYYTFRERFKLNRILRSVTAKHGSVRASREALQQAVALLEGAVEAKPEEWVYWYVLGDLYQPLGEFVKSVKAGEKCYELRPDDRRSPYALASNLRTLTHADYVGDTHQIEARRRLRAQVGTEGYVAPFDPDMSQEALEELGMTLDQAAERSLTLFEEVLSLGVGGDDDVHVRDCLAAMYSEFPHLEERVKSARVAPKGLWAEARGDPFNDAVEHYQKLRYLGNQPDQAKQELLEVIRLCQAALGEQPRNGDALVLLAHALFLAANRAQSLSQDACDYFLTRAGATIQHWKCTPSHTRNRENGELVLWRIRTEIQEARALTGPELDQLMDALRDTLRAEALDPGALLTMQQLLGLDKGPQG